MGGCWKDLGRSWAGDALPGDGKPVQAMIRNARAASAPAACRDEFMGTIIVLEGGRGNWAPSP